MVDKVDGKHEGSGEGAPLFFVLPNLDDEKLCEHAKMIAPMRNICRGENRGQFI